MNKISRIFLILVLIGITSSAAFAQEGMKIRANKLYQSLAYKEAIGLFEVVVARDSMDGESLVRLADCYRLTNDMQKARETYRKAIEKGFGGSITNYYYAQSLMNTGSHTQAEQYMEKYIADSRGPNYVNALQALEDFYKDSAKVSIVKAPFNSPQNDFSPAVFPDDEVVFASSRERAQWIKRTHSWTGMSYYYLYQTKKKDGSYKHPELFEKGLMKKYNNGPIAFNPADSSIMLTANNIGHKDSIGRVRLILKEFQYNSKKGKWNKKPIAFPYNDDQFNTAHAAFSPDGTILFFSSDRPGTFGGMDLWYCTKKDGQWSNPVNMGPAVNTAGNEVFPTATVSGFYFASDGLSGLGGLDMYEMNRGMNGLPFGNPINMGYPLNSGSDDFGLCFKSDRQMGYFTSNRETMDENDEIYEFKVVQKRNSVLMITGIVRDIHSKELIPGSKVYLRDAKGQIVGETIADENAAYSFIAEFNTEYVLDAHKDNYREGYQPIKAIAKINRDVIYKTFVELEKDPDAYILFEVKDEKTSEPLPYATIVLVNQENKTSETLLTDALGQVKYPLIGARIGSAYTFKLDYSADKYFSENHDLSILVTQPGEIKVSEALLKPEVGMDIGKVVHINPIYFDLDKWNIRPDAAVELDKIVKLMKEYPNMVVELGSHTDCRASVAYNMKLSDRRAKSSASYIISKGINKSRIYGKGYGESQLVNGCECEGKFAIPCSEEQHQMNRRTEFVIVKLE